MDTKFPSHNTARIGLPQLLERQADGTLHLDRTLNGSQGTNRHTSRNQIGADNDRDAILTFLEEYKDSPSTQRAYRKEIERLLLWSVLQRKKAISSLDREDFLAYACFLQDPQPSAFWCGRSQGRKTPRFSPLWRPFVGGLSPQAQHCALSILNSFFSYLVQAHYLNGNPLQLIRRKSRVVAQTTTYKVVQRAFDKQEWEAILSEINRKQDQQGARERWLVAVLYFLALRVGELVTHTMGDFQKIRGHWTFLVIGKGQKPAQIPVNAALLDALVQFRTTIGLSPYPHPTDTTPLIADQALQQSLSARRINQIIKGLMQRVANRLKDDAPEKADHVLQASAHWFRHTSLTRQAESGIHFTHLKENARHSKLETTMLYIHTETDERHEQMKKHTWS